MTDRTVFVICQAANWHQTGTNSRAPLKTPYFFGIMQKILCATRASANNLRLAPPNLKPGFDRQWHAKFLAIAARDCTRRAI